MLLFRAKKSEWIIYFLLVWFPFESLVLMYTPIDVYVYVKYIPEILLYGLALGAGIQYIFTRGQVVPRHPILKWVYLIVLLAAVTLVVQWYDPVTWSLGLRQILRFVLLIFICLWMRYDDSIIKNIVWLAITMIGLEAVFGLVQYASGGALDRYLFSTQTINISNRAFLDGAEQTWAPGTRIFGTLGRYDRLGSFLALGLIMLFPWLYAKLQKKKHAWIIAGMSVLGIALVLTKSRASWIAAIVGCVTIGWYIKKDTRVLKVFGVASALLLSYLGVYALLSTQNVLNITERPTQTIAERIFESVSFNAWKQSYEGYGRIFFIINTPRLVVSQYPLFGVGPGRYGGGVAAALANTEVYDRLKIPFGIENKIGQIDNNWMSIWGEFGTLGLIAWIGLFITVIKLGYEVAVKSVSTFDRVIGEGLVGLTIGIMCVGFFGPYFEFRALMFYFWLIVGIVALLWYRIHKNMSLLPH